MGCLYNDFTPNSISFQGLETSVPVPIEEIFRWVLIDKNRRFKSGRNSVPSKPINLKKLFSAVWNPLFSSTRHLTDIFNPSHRYLSNFFAEQQIRTYILTITNLVQIWWTKQYIFKLNKPTFYQCILSIDKILSRYFLLKIYKEFWYCCRCRT